MSHRVLRIARALAPCLAPCVAAQAAEADDIAELKLAIEALRAENRELSQRVKTLEAQRNTGNAAASSPAAAAASAPVRAAGTEQLEQRVKELEISKVAQDDAVRSIIRESVSTLGSKINESVALSGTLGVNIDRSRDFSGERKTSIGLGAADFEFEIKANEWAVGTIKIEYVDGKEVAFQTTSGTQASVDRFNLDTAYITLGDAQRFPMVASAGRMVLPFGISTGHPVADVLSNGSPLTVEAFEMRRDAVGLSVEFPTPAVKPATPPVTAPPVLPMLVRPLIDSFGRRLGYEPLPSRPARLTPITFAPEPPPYSAGVYLFDGSTPGGLRRHFGATLGYRTSGHCGRRYEDLQASALCPWAVNIDLGYNSSIFNSRFFENEYQPFLEQIGRVPAASASVKASMGPFALVGEWNAATKAARFNDSRGSAVAIKPAAWQLSLGYQLGWNPWVQEIGAQGTYLAIGYSRSRDLGGAMRLVNGELDRVGFLPQRRLLLTAGEWVIDGLRLLIEYSRDWDYSVPDGGTGRTGTGLSTTLTYVW